MIDIVREYYRWLRGFVYDERYTNRRSYTKLLTALFETPYIPQLPMDENRAGDGINLRYEFGMERNYSQAMIASELDTFNVTILEMMIALAKRCEECIMVDERYGDRTGQWFWEMVESLGLNFCSDGNFDFNYVDAQLEAFLNGDYAPNGRGGLFTIQNPLVNMRGEDIWTQMNWYLSEYIGKYED